MISTLDLYSLLMKYILLLLTLFTSTLSAQNSIGLVLDQLDSKINERKVFQIEKERRIDALKFSLNNTDDTSQQYILLRNLFNEYKAYQYDSAYHYALCSQELAIHSGQNNNIAQSMCDLLYCYSTVGFFKEAAEIIAIFPDKEVSKSVMATYYEGLFRYYNNLRRYVGSTSPLATEYEQQMVESISKALGILNPNSFRYKLLVAQRSLTIEGDYPLALEQIKRLLTTHNLSLHNQAILYAWSGLCYQMEGEKEHAIHSIALSTIADIESCTYETTSAKVLARYMFERGDIVRASRYINLALADANNYNSQLQRLEIQAVMPRISAQRYDDIVRDRGIIILICGVVALLAFIIVVMIISMSRRNRELRAIRGELEIRAAQLSTTNQRLSQLNDELDQTNKIKDQYIIESLYGDSHFVDGVEKMSKLLIRKIKAKQFSDILEVVGGMGIKRERQRMASAFDSAFLKLFPNFIEEYNKLFAPDDAISLGEDGELTPEVRIFALIRLGVDDSSQIARYLNLSLNTVYVYKAKVKSRSIVAKGEFEDRIRSII